MSITLRENQIPAVEKGIKFFEEREPKPSIIVAPTAYGKSIVVAKIAEGIQDKTIILQPSKELLEQNYTKFTSLGGEASIYSASMGIKQFGHTTYATIGSIKSLGATFKELGYKNAIVDEADRYPRSSDGMFGTFLREAEINKVLGLTATPFKLWTGGYIGDTYSKLVMLTSMSKQGNFFKEVIHVSQIQEMTKLGYWPKLVYELYDFDTGDLVYNSTKADYTEESLNKAFKDQNIDNKIINKIKMLDDRRSILVFVPSVNDAINLSQKIPSSAAIYGDMDKKERDFVIKKFKSLELRVAINVNVLSVGFDHPELDCVIGGRATASLSWFYQAMARATRVHPKKKDALIIDFVGNILKFGKLEDLEFKKDGKNWKLYGTGRRLLTGVRLDKIAPMPINLNSGNESVANDVIIDFGKYKGKKVSETPLHWRNWMLQEFKFNDNTIHIKEELLRLKEINLNSLKV